MQHSLKNLLTNNQDVFTIKADVRYIIQALKPFTQLGMLAIVVDDNQSNCILIKHFLEKWNMETVISQDGFNALENIYSQEYNFILMDIMMSGIDGFEVSRVIRSLAGNKNSKVPIIAVTAAIQKDLKEKVTTARMNDFILKPFNPKELYAKILKNLNGNSIIH